ncbi:hypothetical protein SAMN04489844_1011 [Nocardioides exalbidus]|uniref:Uncharacterized protein n=1 Tax=Nocardioides exalbidus TaxID=402596 RepID=A0A1H4M073_9ACTN|nr:hypothetical protein [Nocardioides exalbidus]SEB76429.1 hypothetical protein SAMN04489844_1011 [Nocardioides exalbidus]
MAVMSPEARTTAAPVRPRPVLALVVALLCAVPYAIGLVLPYYVAGLQHRPAGETLYLHDLDALWPYDTALGGIVSVIAVLGIPLAPFVATAVAGWSAHGLWAGRHEANRREVALLVAAVVIALANLAWLATPLSNDLMVWFLD